MTVAILVQATSQATSSAPFVSTTMSNVPKGVRAYMLKKKVVPRIVPMTQEEIVHVPIIQPEHIIVQHDEMNVEVPVPRTQEEKKRKRNWIEERLQGARKRLNKTNKNNMNNNKNYGNNNNDNNKNN